MIGDKETRQRFKIGMERGVKTDQFAETVGISDSDNVVSLPDGSGVENRRGYAVYKKYRPRPTGDQVGKIVIQLDTQPPNISSGEWLLTALDTSNNNAVVAMTLFKPRCNLAGDTTESQVFFSPDTYTEDYGDSVTVTVLRSGALDRSVTVDYATRDETAVAGTDYTAANGTLTFAANEVSKTISITTDGAGIHTTNKNFSVILSNPINGARIAGTNPATVNLTGTFVEYAPVFFNAGDTSSTVTMYMTSDYSFHTHTLTGQVSGVQKYCFRAGKNTVLVMQTVASDATVTLALYSIEAMMQAGDDSSIAPYATGTFSMTDDLPEWVSLRVFTKDANKFYVTTINKIHRVSLVDCAVSSVDFPDVPTCIRPYTTTESSSPTPHLGLGWIGSNMVCELADSTVPAKHTMCSVNPETGTLAASGVVEGDTYGAISLGITRASFDTVVTDGDNSNVVQFSSSFSPSVILGSTNAASLCANSTGKVWYFSNDDFQMHFGTVSGGTLTVGAGIGTAYEPFAGAFITDADAIFFSMNGSGNYEVNRVDVATGNITHTDVAGAAVSLGSYVQDPFYFNPEYVWGTA